MVGELLSPTLMTIMFLGLTGLYGFVKFSHENDYATEVNLVKSDHHLSGGPARTLITYAYTESQIARENLAFFIDNGLHPSADFIFILNGPSHAASKMIPKEPNVRVVSRPQDDECFDLGAHGEVLREDGLWKKYERFIVLGADVRGPFVPYWSEACWSSAFLSRVTEEVKLVGATATCHPKFHIEPLIWATDSTGIKLLLDPRKDSSSPHANYPDKPILALGGCYKDKDHVARSEVEATSVIQKAGYEVDAMMAAFRQAGNYEETCLKSPAHAAAAGKQRHGPDPHPYETLFVKADGEDVDPAAIARLTEWYKPRGLKGSWDACRRGG
ncbi:hypothetical protein F4811DRAFT_549378 [Daldinia bambusicola]|nr:hypothetical protein F4811DRAFT_549378 [Daldinia bambusicola]